MDDEWPGNVATCLLKTTNTISGGFAGECQNRRGEGRGRRRKVRGNAKNSSTQETTKYFPILLQ